MENKTIEALEKLIQIKDETIKELEKQIQLLKNQPIQQPITVPYYPQPFTAPWYPNPIIGPTTNPFTNPLSPPYIITSTGTTGPDTPNLSITSNQVLPPGSQQFNVPNITTSGYIAPATDINYANQQFAGPQVTNSTNVAHLYKTGC